MLVIFSHSRTEEEAEELVIIEAAAACNTQLADRMKQQLAAVQSLRASCSELQIVG